MKKWIVLCLTGAFAACTHHDFESDKRQIIAKDAIMQKMGRSRSFDIVDFKEDTLPAWTDTTLKNPIRYTLDFEYADSSGTLQKQGVVWFAPNSNAVLDVQISDKP